MSMVFTQINMKDKYKSLNFDQETDKITKKIENIKNRIQTLALKELSSMDKTSICLARERESKFFSKLNDDGKKNFILKKKLFELFSPYEKEEKILEEIFALPNLSEKKQGRKISNQQAKFIETNRISKLKASNENIESERKEEMITRVIKRLGATSFASLSKDFKKDSLMDSKHSFNFGNNPRTMYKLSINKSIHSIPNLKSFKIKQKPIYDRKSDLPSKAESCISYTPYSSLYGGNSKTLITSKIKRDVGKTLKCEDFKFNPVVGSTVLSSIKLDYSNDTKYNLNKNTFKTITDLNKRKNKLKLARKSVFKFLGDEKIKFLLNKDSENFKQSLKLE